MMKPQVFDRVIGQLVGAVPCVGLVGLGEPTLNKHLPVYIRKLKDAGIQVLLITNGSLLSDSLVDDLVAAGPDGVIVSFTGNQREAYGLIIPHRYMVASGEKSVAGWRRP